MALTWNGMPCAICREPILDPSSKTLCFTFYGITDLRFAKLDDAACHQSCIDNWHLRDEFIDYYNEHCRDELRINRRGHVCYRIEWSDFFFNIAILWIGGILLLPMIPVLDISPKTTGGQWLGGLVVVAALLALVVIAVQLAGYFWGVVIAAAIWLLLDVIAIVVMILRSP